MMALKNSGRAFASKGSTSRRLLWAVGAVVVSLAAHNAAYSQSTKDTAKAGDVQLVLRALKVVSKADGSETLVPAGRIKPGEVIEYQVRYTNTGSRAIRNLQATLPIPGALEFITGSASPAAPLASTDGKRFEAMPLKREVKTANGLSKTVLVPAAEYRYLRWSLGELAAGKSISVSARARLEKSAPSAR